MLYLCHDIESFASGFKRVYTLCKENDVSCSYEKTPIGFSFIFLRNDPNAIINVSKREYNVPIILSKTEKLVYEILKEQPSLTREELAIEISKTTKTVQRALDSLKAKGLIVRVGTNRKGYWKTTN